MNRPLLHNRESAFTLIELLVVISILVVLAAMTTISVRMIRNSADSSRCMGNLRTVHLAILGYAADFRQSLPAGRFLGHNAYVSYDDLLVPYDGRGTLSGITGADDKTSTNTVTGTIDPEALKLWNLYRCPAERLQQRSGDWDPTKMVRSYAMNGAYDQNVSAVPARYRGVYCKGSNPAVGQSPNAGSQSWSIRLTAIGNASSTIMLAELRYLYGYLGGSLGETVANPDDQLDPRLTTEPLHNQGWNYLFADGHSQHLRPSDTVAPGKPLDSNTKADMTGSMWWRP